MSHKGLMRRLGKTIYRYHCVIRQRGKGTRLLSIERLMGIEIGTFSFMVAHVLNCCFRAVMYSPGLAKRAEPAWLGTTQ